MLGLALVLTQVVSLVSSHGNMVVPLTWHDTEQMGLQIGKKDPGCVKEDLPDHDDSDDWPTIHGRTVCQNEWFTNHTYIPGEATIPEDMLGEGGHGKNPWFAPGTAPVYSPCGTYGGNPFGCQPDREEKYGDCCARDRCGGFALGPNAEDLDWPEAAVTGWIAGSVQEVAWYVGPNHGGGYSYRLCKLPEGGTADLTEECFQEMTLDFTGDKQWVILHNEEHRKEVVAKRTREGTFPPGSQWTKNPLKSDGEVEHGHVIDYVEVPANIEPGRYILSFRWDCQKSQQIWNVCANIDIV